MVALGYKNAAVTVRCGRTVTDFKVGAPIFPDLQRCIQVHRVFSQLGRIKSVSAALFVRSKKKSTKEAEGEQIYVLNKKTKKKNEIKAYLGFKMQIRNEAVN